MDGDYKRYMLSIGSTGILAWPEDNVPVSLDPRARQLSLGLLDPDRLLPYAENADLQPAHSGAILRTIISILYLRHRMKQKITGFNGEEVVIGGDIPQFTVSTVELSWN